MSSLLSQRGGALRALKAVTAGSSAPSSSKTILTPSPISQCIRHASTSTTRLSLSVGPYKFNLDVDFTLPSFLSSMGGSAQPPLALALDGYAPSEESADQENPLEWDGFLNAVPKSRVSHSRKRMRSANKGLKDRVDLVHCAGCGTPKLLHHICAVCYSDISKRQKVSFKSVRLEKLEQQKDKLLRNIQSIARNLSYRRMRAEHMIHILEGRFEHRLNKIIAMGGSLGVRERKELQAIQEAKAAEEEVKRAREEAERKAELAAQAAQLDAMKASEQAAQPQQ